MKLARRPQETSRTRCGCPQRRARNEPERCEQCGAVVTTQLREGEKPRALALHVQQRDGVPRETKLRERGNARWKQQRWQTPKKCGCGNPLPGPNGEEVYHPMGFREVRRSRQAVEEGQRTDPEERSEDRFNWGQVQ